MLEALSYLQVRARLHYAFIRHFRVLVVAHANKRVPYVAHYFEAHFLACYRGAIRALLRLC